MLPVASIIEQMIINVVLKNGYMMNITEAKTVEQIFLDIAFKGCSALILEENTSRDGKSLCNNFLPSGWRKFT